MPRSERFALALTLLVVGGGLALRWLHLDAESLWYDEGYTAWLAQCPPGRIVRNLSVDIGAPLHYVLLHYWSAIFGDGDAALRSFSALCSTAALGVFWVLARRMLMRPWAVMWAVALFSMSVIQVEQAREARYYALLSLLGVLMLDGMDRFLGRGSRWGFAQFVLSSAAALYCHNVAAFYLIAAQLAWLLWPTNRDEGGRMKDEPEPASQPSSLILPPYLSLLLADILIALLYAPWLPVLRDQLRWMGQAGFWDSTPTFSELLWTIAVLAGVKSWYPGRAVTWLRGGDWEHSTEIASATIVLILLAILAMVLWRGGRAARRLAAGLATFALLPVLILFVQSLVRQPAFVERTLIMSSAALCLLLAIPVDGARRCHVARVVLLAGLLIAAIFSVAGLLGEEHKEDWRSVARYITSLPEQRRLVIFLGNEGELPFNHYAARAPRHPYQATGAPRGFFDLDPPQTIRRVLGDTDLEALKARLGGGAYREIVLILRNEPYYDPGGRARQLLGKTCLFSAERRFHLIRVLTYTPRPGDYVSCVDGVTAAD